MAGWWLLSPGVPSHIKKAVFDESKFAEPLLLQLPGDDREMIAQLKAKQRGEQQTLPMFHASAIQQFQSPEEKALLGVLIENGFAEVKTMETDSFQGPRNVKLLMYRDTLGPYRVGERTTREGKTQTRQALLAEPESQFTSPFQITIGTRQLKSIDYTNAYQGQIPPLGVKTDFYAVTFSYRLRGRLSRPSEVRHGIQGEG